MIGICLLIKQEWVPKKPHTCAGMNEYNQLL